MISLNRNSSSSLRSEGPFINPKQCSSLRRSKTYEIELDTSQSTISENESISTEILFQSPVSSRDRALKSAEVKSSSCVELAREDNSTPLPTIDKTILSVGAGSPDAIAEEDENVGLPPRRIPGTQKFLFDANIPEHFVDRYEIITRLLKYAMDMDGKLRLNDHTRNVVFDLRMCGTSERDKAATVVVFCRPEICLDLKRLFNSRNIQEHFKNHEISKYARWKSLLRYIQGNTTTTTQDDARPPLKLIFYQTPKPRTLASGTTNFVIEPKSPITLCGASFEILNRRATVALVLDIGSKLFGLTVNHVLGSDDNLEQDRIGTSKNTEDRSWMWFRKQIQKFMIRVADIAGSGEEITDINDDLELWEEDTKYDTQNLPIGCEEDVVQDRIENDPNTQVIYHHISDPVSSNIALLNDGSPVGSFSPGLFPENPPGGLDYLLFEIKGDLIRPNCFFTTGDPHNPLFIYKHLTICPKSRLKVFVISALAGTREGILLPAFAFVTASRDEEPHEVWNVIMGDDNGICGGECGSLVVTQNTREIVGHVISYNPLGEAQVTPFKNTLDKITSQFGGAVPVIPRPIELLSKFQQYCSTYHETEKEPVISNTFKALLKDESFEVARDLGYAVANGYHLAVQALLKESVNLDSQPINGQTALFLAVEAGQVDMARNLLENEASVNLTDIYGQTPLFLAAEAGNTDVVKILLEHQASVDLRNFDNQTPLSIAVKAGNTDVVKILLEHKASVNLMDFDDQTLLFSAAKAKNTDMVKILRKHKASVNLINFDNQTPLFIAVKAGNSDVVKILLEYKASVNLYDYRKRTPLFLAAQAGNPDIAKILLEHQALINLRDYQGRTPLHAATENVDNADVVELLLKAGSDPNAIDKENMTPLHIFAMQSESRPNNTLRQLLNYGANPNLKQNDGLTALQIAAGNFNRELLDFLLVYSLDVATEGSSKAEETLKDEMGHLNEGSAAMESSPGRISPTQSTNSYQPSVTHQPITSVPIAHASGFIKVRSGSTFSCWYCCRCDDGPWGLHIWSCAYCGHNRCTDCKAETYK